MCSKRKGIILMSSLAGVMAMNGTAALAQSTGEGPPGTAATTPAAANARANGSALLASAPSASSAQPATGEIIVTAQKRATNLQKLPATISVVSGETMQNLEIRTLEKLNTLIPGFNFERAAGGNSILAIRGVGTTSAGQSLEQSVAGYINGVYMGGNIREFSTPLYDIGQIEVLKGTQSGISGQNTSVGALNIVTRLPGDRFGGYALVGHEFKFDGWNAEAAVDVPLSSDLKLRVSGLYDDVGGYVKNLATGRWTGGGKTYSGRANLVWTASSTVKVKLYGQYDHTHSFNNTLVPFGNPISPLYSLFIPGLSVENSTVNQYTSHGEGGDAFFRYNNLRGSMTIDVDLGGPVLTSITSASRLRDELALDIDLAPVDFLALTQSGLYRQVHQEVRIVSPSNQRLSYIFGAWLRHSKQDKSIRYYTDTLPGPPPFINLGGYADIPFEQTTDTRSVFGDLHYKIDKQLVVGGTLRFTSETKKGAIEIIANPTSGFAPYPRTTGKLTPNFVDGSAAVQYSPADSINLYALYAHGTKTGAFIDQTPVLTSVRPEKTDTFELGAKLKVPDARLTFNGSAFRMNVKDYQDVFAVVTPTGIRFIPQNRDLYTQGIELQSNWRPLEGLSLGGAALFLHSREKATGEDAARSPKLTVSGNARYEVPLSAAWKAAAFVNASHSSSYVNTVRRPVPFPTGPGTTDPNFTRSPAHSIIDVGVQVFQETGFSAKFVVQNVTNEHAYATVDVLTLDPTSRQGALLPLRRMVLTLGYSY